MVEIVMTGNATDLPKAINDLFVPHTALMFLERAPSHRLSEVEIINGIELTTYNNTISPFQWERGRIFCQAWELRWKDTQAIYTGANIALTGFVSAYDLSACVRRRASYYLWGARNGQRYIDLQIARELRYPITTGNRIKLVVAEWFDNTGEIVASRFAGLETT